MAQKYREGEYDFDLPVSEISMRNKVSILSPFLEDVARINRYSVSDTELGIGLIHNHKIQSYADLSGIKKMNVDILMDSSTAVTKAMSKDFFKFARKSYEKKNFFRTSLDLTLPSERTQGLMSVDDFLVLFNDDAFGTKEQNTIATFSAIAEMHGDSSKIGDVNVYNPSEDGLNLPNEEVDYLTGVARGAKKVMLEAAVNRTFTTKDPRKRAIIKEAILSIEAGTTLNFPEDFKLSD